MSTFCLAHKRLHCPDCTRQPLGERNPVEVATTVRRVTGKDRAPALDVAAFQSFTD